MLVSTTAIVSGTYTINASGSSSDRRRRRAITTPATNSSRYAADTIVAAPYTKRLRENCWVVCGSAVPSMMNTRMARYADARTNPHGSRRMLSSARAEYRRMKCGSSR